MEKQEKQIKEKIIEERIDTEETEFKPVKERQKMTKQKKTIIILSIILGIILLITLFSTIFAIINAGNDKIIGKVDINGIDVSGLSEQEAIAKIEELAEETINKEITFSHEEFQTTISPKQLDVSYPIEEAVKRAYSVGRENGIIQNNYQIIKTNLLGSHINMDVNYNEEELVTRISDINSKIPKGMKDSSYYIEEDKLIITKGQEGLAVKTEQMKQEIINRLRTMKTTTENVGIPVEVQSPKPIDIEKIHSEIYKEAKDAYYTTDPFKLYPHIDGIDFAISIEEAKEMIKQEKEEYIIPLKITKPEITTDKLGNKAFPDLLSTFSTKYDASNIARSKNLALAAGKINGTIVMPGEIFSYNKVVGERTIAAGYQEAKIYENGKVVDGLGGGICQISSTLYNTVVYANLDIVSRRNHQFLTSYVGAGKDATVVYGAIDFKFKNTRKYPIKLVCSVKNGIAKIDMYGIKEEIEYKVEIRTTITSTSPYTTSYTEDSTLEAGREIVKQKGMNGCKSQTYKVLLLNGKVISKTLLSKDSYNPMQRIVVKGTKTKEEPQAPNKEEPKENNPTANEQPQENGTANQKPEENSTANGTVE